LAGAEAALRWAYPTFLRRERKEDMPLSLEEVSDRLEIEQLLVRYCYAVDDRDWNTYRKIFTPDEEGYWTHNLPEGFRF
jgi:hypothetical protein